MATIHRFYNMQSLENQLYTDVYEAIFKLWIAEAKAIVSTNDVRGEEEIYVSQKIKEFFEPNGNKELIRKKANKFIDFKITCYNMSLFENGLTPSNSTEEQREELIKKVNDTTNDMFYITNKLSNYFTFFYDENYVLVVDVAFMGNKEELTDLEKYEIHVYVEDQHDNLPF